MKTVVTNKDVIKFIRGNCTMIDNGDNKFYFMPFWFCDIDEGMIELISGEQRAEFFRIPTNDTPVEQKYPLTPDRCIKTK